MSKEKIEKNSPSTHFCLDTTFTVQFINVPFWERLVSVVCFIPSLILFGKAEIKIAKYKECKKRVI